MIIFIDDKPIKLLTQKKWNNQLLEDDFQSIIDASLSPFKPTEFKGHTLILNFHSDLVEKLFYLLHHGLTKNFNSLTILCEKIKPVKTQLFKFYDLVKAAGGIVRNEENKLLHIYRLKKWDLPKGKMEKGESSRLCAVREIKEECNVDAIIQEKICTTYHTYSFRNRRALKKTKWYLMTGNNDHLIPQKEEGIERVEWIAESDLSIVVRNTYSSIRYVLNKYQELLQIL